MRTGVGDIVALQMHAHDHAGAHRLVGKEGRFIDRDGALLFGKPRLAGGEAQRIAQQMLKRQPVFVGGNGV